MDFYLKFPRNKKEFCLFLLVVSVISVNIIAPLITCFEFGFTISVWAGVYKVMPFIWLSVIALVLLTHKPAQFMTRKIIKKEDSFNAHITINVLCTVFLMSIFLTVFATWIGSGKISIEPIKFFFYKWPRNFAIAFFVELIIAQPIAMSVMKLIHKK